MYYFRRLLESRIKLPPAVELEDYELEENGTLGLTLKVLDRSFVIYRKIALKIEKVACPECSRQKSEWLSKVQLRGLDEVSIDEILRMLSKQEGIVKIQEARGGIDIYFFSQSKGRKLASRLKKRFGFSEKRSYEQHGHDFDKRRPNYREIISLR